MEQLIIRRGIAADAATIIRFNKSMALETEGIILADEIITEGVKNLISHPEKGFYLVAEIEGAVVGTLMITTEWSDWRNGTFWWVQSVFVQPEYRRLGIYRKMYEHIKQIASNDMDICGYRLYVEQENHNAQETYKSMGMKKTHYLLYEELK